MDMFRLLSMIIIVFSVITVPTLAGLDSCANAPFHQEAVDGEKKTDKSEKTVHPFLHGCYAHVVAIPSRDRVAIAGSPADIKLPRHDDGRAGQNPAPLLEPPSHA